MNEYIYIYYCIGCSAMLPEKEIQTHKCKPLDWLDDNKLKDFQVKKIFNDKSSK